MPWCAGRRRACAGPRPRAGWRSPGPSSTGCGGCRRGPCALAAAGRTKAAARDRRRRAMVAEPKRMARRRPAAALALAALLAVGEAAGVEGRLEWAQRVTLGFAVGGVVERVAVRAGDRVRAGALLARLDTRPFDARVRELAARAEALVPELEEARRERDRTEALYERAVIAEHERQLAHIAYARA
ncbi:MAG TPA: biotin/lipoyl-binding protein, partial [Chromatiales bacterium]|nr:biotin/lipoyl-binding protein [Chromatiales bacterium]